MALPWPHRTLLAALRRLPRNAVSRLAGRAADWRLPGPLLRSLILAFARAYDVNLAEMREPLSSFATFQAFFTRALKDGARPLDAAADALLAPCDGGWGEAGIVERGTLLQVKGKSYRLRDLLHSESDAARFEGGAYATFYLAPRDYHRFHAPCAMSVVRATYVPGTLWPVNRIGLEAIDSLFARNERICAYMEPEGGGADRLLCLVAVGATVVGKVRVRFDDLTTNAGGAAPLTRTYAGSGQRFERGEEWGRFEIGSTIVLLASPGLVELEIQAPGSAVRLGSRIGRIVGGTRDEG
jgi:phosphatidylserine decarboxylase